MRCGMGVWCWWFPGPAHPPGASHNMRDRRGRLHTAGLLTGEEKVSMIVFVTTADTEILALSQVARDLPEGFPALKAVNPTRLPRELEPATLAAGAALVLVRLLGGRRAWE